ncbi:MAG: sigma-54-dependent Fis family transcriptional regulator [Deltaproteobacteria bacterium]|nr:sigma-54-dependent Fis family transcriptional regulator [Deltaproteobacteria bacterium]
MALVLVVDDDRQVRETIVNEVHRIGHEAHCAASYAEGLAMSLGHVFALVLVDVQLPDGNGLDMLPLLRETQPCPEVIIMTVSDDPDGAELAIRNGAWDYVHKPFTLKIISLTLTRALQYHAEKSKHAIPVPLIRDMIIGNSPAIKECLHQVALAAASGANTLICGETGTGKELFAMAVHQNSSRVDNSFVVIDCSALPVTLVESLLFGHEKGAYTGADRAQMGLIAQADNGTLFLDEIGELPLSIQKAFLRVIQERRYRPVGSRREIVSNFVLIAATNRNLDEMAKRGEFRDDLLHRLKTIQMVLPPLREHREDIKAITQSYVSRFCLNHKIVIKGFTPEFFDVLELYDWPGNVRELNHALERAIASAGPGPILYPMDLPMEIRAKLARESVYASIDHPASQNSDTHDKSFPQLEKIRSAAIIEAERSYLIELMKHVEGNVTEAIATSGLSRARFYALLKKHGITNSLRNGSS